MSHYETTADVMENNAIAVIAEQAEWDYYHKALDKSGRTQYDYDFADNNPFFFEMTREEEEEMAWAEHCPS